MMNSSRYYPFERNRYFYGKLLTVRDFDSEQRYFNHKRRLINRLLHGVGVVSGLHVVAVDDKTVSIEMGLALDQLGREIIVPAPITLKLSTIEGFSNNEYGKNVYLCLAYNEKGKEPVHSVSNSSTRSEEVSEYNRIVESYKVFIQEEPPQPSAFEIAALLQDTCVMYQDEQIRILQTTPRYIHPDQEFKVEVKIEKTLQTPKLSLEFEVDSEAFELTDHENSSKISLTEAQDEQKTELLFTYVLKTKQQAHHNQAHSLGFKSDTAFLTKGDQRIALEANVFNKLKITKNDLKAQLLKDYYSRTLDQSVHASAEPCIYLAKIDLLQMGPTYMIEKIEEVPFQEYVYNASFIHQLDYQLNKPLDNQTPAFYKESCKEKSFSQIQGLSVKSKVIELKEDQKPVLDVSYQEQLKELHFSLGLPKPKTASEEVRTGVVDIKLGQRGMFFKSKGFYSEEIPHGLGRDGSIIIMTGIEESTERVVNKTTQIFFGNTDVFKDSEYESELSNLSLGTVLNVDKGTFKIGVRIQGTVSVPTVRIRWWAIKKTVLDTVQKVDQEYLHNEIAVAEEGEPKK